MEVMSVQLPLLKAGWLASGDTPEFLRHLRNHLIRGWRIFIAKYEPVRFQLWG